MLDELPEHDVDLLLGRAVLKAVVEHLLDRPEGTNQVAKQLDLRLSIIEVQTANGQFLSRFFGPVVVKRQ